jgi:hypothetical protein
MVVLT